MACYQYQVRPKICKKSVVVLVTVFHQSALLIRLRKLIYTKVVALQNNELFGYSMPKDYFISPHVVVPATLTGSFLFNTNCVDSNYFFYNYDTLKCELHDSVKQTTRTLRTRLFGIMFHIVLVHNVPLPFKNTTISSADATKI